MPNSLHQRFARLPAPSPAERLALRLGTMRDYAALAPFHYLSRAPATATRVIVLVDTKPGCYATPVNVRERGVPVVGDVPGLRSNAAKPGCYATPVNVRERGVSVVGDVPGLRSNPALCVAVLVESLPALACAMRDAATGGRYVGHADRSVAADLLNAEVRCISRVIVHPQWRGLGLAVRLVRHALETMTTRYTEALAAMGHVHPLFVRAGMTAYRRWPLPRDQRLLDALGHAGVEPWELASTARMQQHLAESSQHAAFVKQELSRWAGRRLSLEEQLHRARTKLLHEPVYYIKLKETSEEAHEGHEETKDTMEELFFR